MPGKEPNLTERDGRRALDALLPALDLDAGDALLGRNLQIPVRPNLVASGDRDLGAEIGLQPEPRRPVRLCRNALILSLLEALALGLGGAHYSRDRNAYTRDRGRLPEHWTYGSVMAAVETLTADPAIIGHNRVQPQNPRARGFTPVRSSIFAGPRFIDDLGCTDGLGSSMTGGDRVIIRDAEGRSKPVPDRPLVRSTEAFFARYDGFVGAADLAIAHPGVRWLAPTVGVMPMGNHLYRIDLDRRHLVRIFKGGLSRGGRWYRAFWLEMPKHLRSSLLINGQPVFEHDYSACHLRLAYFAVGAGDELAALGDRGHYELPGFDPTVWRKAIKVGVQILLNARTGRGALGALAAFLPHGAWDEKLTIAGELIPAIKAAHPALSLIWHRGCGLGLQLVDSEIVRLSLEDLMDHGVLGLPIHDAIMVAAPHRDLLVEVMESRFAKVGERLSKARFADLRRRGFRGQNLTIGREERERMGGDEEEVTGDNHDLLDAAARRSHVPGSTESPPSDVFDDLEKLVQGRRRWRGGILRAALLELATTLPTRPAAVDAFHAWAAGVTMRTGVAITEAETRHEVTRFLGRKAGPIAPASMARLCAVPRREAEKLGLNTILPARRRAPADVATLRRARRLEDGIVPRIVDIGAAAPWVDARLRRSKWFVEVSDPIDRQASALSALLRRGPLDALASARAELAAVKRARALLDGRRRLPVDELINRLDGIMGRHDFPECTIWLGFDPSSMRPVSTAREVGGFSARTSVDVVHITPPKEVAGWITSGAILGNGAA